MRELFNVPPPMSGNPLKRQDRKYKKSLKFRNSWESRVRRKFRKSRKSREIRKSTKY